MSAFSYCPIIWMFCGIVANRNANRVQRRALRAVYNDYKSDKSIILSNGNHLTIHERNINFLILEVFKNFKKKLPPILDGIFLEKYSPYDLRVKNLLVLPSDIEGVLFGIVFLMNLNV